METLQIEKKNAIKAYNQADDKGKSLLSDLFGKGVFNPVGAITTFSQVCEAAGVNENDYVIATNISDDDKAVMQLRRMRLICRVFNGDWVPNAADINQRKYYPWFRVVPDESKPSGFGLSYYVFDYVNAFASLGSRLYFKDVETAKYVGETFTSEYINLFSF